MSLAAPQRARTPRETERWVPRAGGGCAPVPSAWKGTAADLRPPQNDRTGAEGQHARGHKRTAELAHAVPSGMEGRPTRMSRQVMPTGGGPTDVDMAVIEPTRTGGTQPETRPCRSAAGAFSASDIQRLTQAAVAAAIAPLGNRFVGLHADVQAMRGHDLEDMFEEDDQRADVQPSPGRGASPQKLRTPGPYAK